MQDDTSPFGFGRFIPGFDFLQNLAKGANAGAAGVPPWVAPTASVQELDKRIQELKTVQFWLEQNARALTATVQALEVQKMTLATLAGMNVAMGDMAAAFGGLGGAAGASPAAAPQPAAPAPKPDPGPAAAAGTPAERPRTDGTAPAAMVDPVQWWSALTQQFQDIAARAMQDAASHQAAFDATAPAGGQGARSAAPPPPAGKAAAAAPGPADAAPARGAKAGQKPGVARNKSQK